MAYFNNKQLLNINYAGIVDEQYNPNSKNAQSGTAVAEALSTKANLQLKTLDVTEYVVMTDLLIGTHIYELQTLVVNPTGDYELTFTNGSSIITAPNEAFKEGNKYLISARMDNETGWVFDVVAEVVEFAVNEEWVQIADLTLEEDTPVYIDKDVNGNPFNLKKFTVVAKLEAKEGDTYSSGIRVFAKTKDNSTNFYLINSMNYPKNVQSTHRIEATLEHWWACKSYCGSGHLDYSIFPDVNSARTVPLGNCDGLTKPVNYLRLQHGDYGINKGSRIIIWGVNA